MSRREQAQTAELWVLQYPQKPTLKKKARPELCGSLQQGAAGCCTDQSGQASRSRSDLQRTDLSRHKQSHCLWKPCSTLRNAASQEALQLKPNYPEANLGIALQEQGDLQQQSPPTTPLFNSTPTTQISQQPDLSNTALQLKPNYPDAHNNLGNALKEQGDLTAAIASYNTALQLKPNYPDAHNNLGNALKEQGDLTAAIASYNTALQLKPNYPDAHNNLGNALKEQGDLTAAIASYNSALQLKPNYPEAHNNLGNALKEQG